MKVEGVQTFRTFSSIGAAIADARALQELNDQKYNVKQLYGSTIEHVAWDDRHVTIRLSGSHFLHINAMPQAVEWAIGRERATNGSGAARLLQLQFPGDQLAWNWDRGGILEQRLGGRFTRIFESDVGIFLYVEGCRTLLFSCLAVAGDFNNLILFWRDTE